MPRKRWFTVLNTTTGVQTNVYGISALAALTGHDYYCTRRLVNEGDKIVNPANIVFQILGKSEPYIGYKKSINFRDQLCVHCLNYVDGCVWAKSHAEIPVKGWTAEPTYDKYGRFFTWHVLDCPEFKEDPKCPRVIKKDTTG